MRRTLGVLLIMAMSALGATAADAKAHKGGGPDATIQFSSGSVAAGIGFSWGSGTLRYKGKSYPIKVDGLTVGAVGITRANATGSVYHLKRLEDFPGTYAAVGAGAAVGGGGSVASMQNQNGVVINARSTSQGVKLKLGVDGVTMSLKE
jgi:hypothetical protein